MEGQDNKGFDYKEWFEKNREAVNERRRRRYREDPRYREKVRASAKFHYWTKVRDARNADKKNDLDKMEPAEVVPIKVTNPYDARYGQTLEVNCYTAGQLGDLLFGRSTQTMRLWERNGVIPPAMIRNNKNHRLYTEDQMEIFLEYRHLLKVKSKSFYEDSLFSREVHSAWKQLPDGIEVMEAIEKKAQCTDPLCGKEKVVRVADEDEQPLVICDCGGRMKILE